MDYTKYEHKLTYCTRSSDPNAWNAYREEAQQLVEMFKQDLFNELGIADNPKREKLFEIAGGTGMRMDTVKYSMRQSPLSI